MREWWGLVSEWCRIEGGRVLLGEGCGLVREGVSW